MGYPLSMQPPVTEDEYLASERLATEKHELINGRIVAMSGATMRHNAICTNLIILLGTRLRGGPCGVLTSDQRTHVPGTGLFTYPDVTVVCGELRTHAKDSHTLLTPTLLVEVLSPSTEAYDRGAKFRHYQSIETLREYLLVGSVERAVEHYRRLPSQTKWELSSYDDPASLIALPALGIELSLAEIYEGTERFPL